METGSFIVCLNNCYLSDFLIGTIAICFDSGKTWQTAVCEIAPPLCIQMTSRLRLLKIPRNSIECIPLDSSTAYLRFLTHSETFVSLPEHYQVFF